MTRYLTNAEVAELCRVTTQTLREWRHRGTGPRGFTVGRRVLYDEHDVSKWLEEVRANSEDKNR